MHLYNNNKKAGPNSETAVIQLQLDGSFFVCCSQVRFVVLFRDKYPTGAEFHCKSEKKCSDHILPTSSVINIVTVGNITSI